MHLHDPLTGRLRSVRAHPFGFLAMGATIALIPWTLLYIAQRVVTIGRRLAYPEQVQIRPI